MAKKPPPVAVEPSGVFVKIPVSPETAAALGELFAIGAEILDRVQRGAKLAGALEGKATRALARPRRRPRARRR